MSKLMMRHTLAKFFPPRKKRGKGTGELVDELDEFFAEIHAAFCVWGKPLNEQPRRH
jgi:hypothetical protein